MEEGKWGVDVGRINNKVKERELIPGIDLLSIILFLFIYIGIMAT